MNTDSSGATEAIDITLTGESAIYPELATPVLERHYGAKPEIEADNVEIRIGSRPLCRDLRQLYEQSGRTVPADLQDLFVSYRVVMLVSSMSVMREPGKNGVTRIGFEIKFPIESGVMVIENLPKTEFIKPLVIEGDSKFMVEAGVALSGKLMPVTDAQDLLPNSMDVLPGVAASAKARLEMTNKVDIVAKFSHEISSPIVAMVGEGDTYSQWVITRQKRPLLGDFPFTQILLVPKNTELLEFSVRVSAVLRTFHLIPDKRRSKWVELSADLPE